MLGSIHGNEYGRPLEAFRVKDEDTPRDPASDQRKRPLTCEKAETSNNRALLRTLVKRLADGFLTDS